MSTTVKVDNKDPIMFIVAVLAAQVIGGMVTQMSPLVVGGAISGLRLTEQQAGMVAFAEFSVLSATAILIAPLLPRLSTRTLCFSAAGIAITAQFISLFLTELYVLVFVRCIAGVGEGLIYAASLAVVASRSANPDKVYGYVQITWALLSTILFTVGGHLTDMYAHRGIYGMIFGLTLVLILLLRWLPTRVAEAEQSTEDDDDAASPVMGIITLAGIFIYLTVSAAIYTFTAPLGERAGLSTSQIGYALTTGSAIGFTGALMATWLNVRKGRVMPITVFSVAFAILAVVLCLNTNPVIYVVALVLTVVFFYFSIPYLYGLAAALDRKGRWAAAAGSAYLLGFAVGPAFAGTMIEWFDYAGLGIASVIGTVLAWILLMLVVRNLAVKTSDA